MRRVTLLQDQAKYLFGHLTGVLGVRGHDERRRSAAPAPELIRVLCQNGSPGGVFINVRCALVQAIAVRLNRRTRLLLFDWPIIMRQHLEVKELTVFSLATDSRYARLNQSGGASKGAFIWRRSVTRRGPAQ